AIGATRFQLIRRTVVEIGLLVAIGSCAGLLFANWTAHALVSLTLKDAVTPVSLNTGPDLRVMAFTTAVAVATTVIVAAPVVWHTARQDVAVLLQRSGPTVTKHRAALWLATLQIALSAVLLVHATLLIHGVLELRSVDAGLRTAGVTLGSLFTTES